MEHFPFKKVTVTSGGEAGRTAVKESLNFSSARSRVHFVVQLRLRLARKRVHIRHGAFVCMFVCVSDRKWMLPGVLEGRKLARGKNLWNDARATASLPPSKVQLRWLTLASAVGVSSLRLM